MNITWYGHRCVRIECKEGSVLIDPFDPKEIGLRGPTIKDDLILISDPAPARTILDRIDEDAFVVRGPGEYERKGIAVRGIPACADSQEGKELGLCAIYSVIAEGMSVCHLGGIGQEKLTAEQLEAIGDPDILIIPVGGQSALDAKAAAALANEIEPKIIIPIQYAVSGAHYEATSLEKFVKEIGLAPQTMDKLRMTQKQLPTEQTNLIVLEV